MSKKVKAAVGNHSGFCLGKIPEISRDGKEESYERKPGRVPFVFNPKFFELFEV